MKTRTLLVDSNYLLKRSFHGAKNTNTNKFGSIGGLYSFYTTIRKLIKQHSINKTVLFWDGENGGIYRNRLDREYKANRKSKEWYRKIEMSSAEIRREQEKEESILKQRKRIQAYGEELFLRQIEVDQIEADDLIAYYSINYNKNEDIFLFSNDRDFAQLLEHNITILFPNKDKPITKDNYLLEFGHHYLNALTMKILCGDVSDNIKGINGLKETTILKHFPDVGFKYTPVRDICKQSKLINEQRQQDKKKPLKVLNEIITNIDRLKLNHKLMNLSEPMLNSQAVEELQQLAMPLSPEGRSSKNLYDMMAQDEFLLVYGGSFVSYVEPFYSVIMAEKQRFMDYMKK